MTIVIFYNLTPRKKDRVGDVMLNEHSHYPLTKYTLNSKAIGALSKLFHAPPRRTFIFGFGLGCDGGSSGGRLLSKYLVCGFGIGVHDLVLDFGLYSGASW